MQISDRSSSPRFSLIVLLIVVASLIPDASAIIPTSPIIASPNTESSPSNFMMSFQLSNPLPASGYLMVVFPIYSSTVTPTSCLLLGTTNIATQCVNLNTASSSSPNPLTINSSSVTTVNVNIVTTKTVVIQFTSSLLAGTTYTIQILVSSILPYINALSANFEMYTMSATGVMIEENWNFGNVFFEAKNNNIMNVVSINSLTTNLPGTTTSSFLAQISIGIACPTATSRLLFTISNNFYFSVSSLVNTIAVTGSAPQITSTTIMSQNVIMVVFGEQFTVGRTFRLTISNILNPLSISTGSISIYSLAYNSISPLEVY